MRGKLAKELRVIAEEMCDFDNAPYLGYVGGEPPVFENMGKFTVKVKKGVPRRLDKGCIRFFYKYLKKKAKKARGDLL